MNSPKSPPRLVLAFIETGDGKRLKDFYANLLGLPIRKEFGSTWTEYGDDESHRLAVHQPSDLGPDEETRLYLSFEVEHIDDLRAQLKSAGVECSDIRHPDRGRFFTCRDPAGNRLHFIEFSGKWRETVKY